MISSLIARLKQGYRTLNYPQETPPLPERYRGLPTIDSSRCAKSCAACREACPASAIKGSKGKMTLDLGKCVFCTECTGVCSTGAIQFSGEHRMAARNRQDLVLSSSQALMPAVPLDEPIRRLLGRSLRLRQVSAGGCNACEADTNVLGTLAYDLGRFGIQFVASPRHADGILITGPVSRNMALAVKKTYDSIPAPKIVIAVGACAISGGLFAGHDETLGGAGDLLPVDLYIPGCPPHPLTILNGLLALLGRLPK